MFKISFLGCSRIGNKIAETIKKMPEFELYSCATKDNIKRAEEYASTLGFKKAYGSYEELLKDKDIDLVYISNLIIDHFNTAMMCLKSGHNVIMEKSFTINKKEAEELINYAESHKLFITEAQWTRYMPSYKRIKELQGIYELGEIQNIKAALGYMILTAKRLKRLDMGGSALLDIGVYPLNFVFNLLGTQYTSFDTKCKKNNDGVDMTATVDLKYKNQTASTKFSSITNLNHKGIVDYENGRIIVDNVNNPKKIIVIKKNNNKKDSGNLKIIEKIDEISGYEYQFIESKQAIENKKTECESYTHEDIIFNMGFYDLVRQKLRIKFPTE